MPPPPVVIYVTSLTSAPKVRKHIELLHRALGAFEIPYESFDLATDEEAKRRWQIAKPPGKVVGLPGFTVGGEFIGTMDDFEEAVETGTLERFLRQDTDHDASMTIGEAELDKLMREMTDADLDNLAGDLSKGEGKKDVGALISEQAQAAEAGAAASAPGSVVPSLSATRSPATSASVGGAGKSVSALKKEDADAANAGAAAVDAVKAAEAKAVAPPSVTSATIPPTAPADLAAEIAKKEPADTVTQVEGPSLLDSARSAIGLATAGDRSAAVEAEARTSTGTGTSHTNARAPAPDAAGGLLSSASAALSSAATALSDAASQAVAGIQAAPAAAAAFADEASGVSELEAPSAPVEDDGPAVGETTLDEVIDATMKEEAAGAGAK